MKNFRSSYLLPLTHRVPEYLSITSSKPISSTAHMYGRTLIKNCGEMNNIGNLVESFQLCFPQVSLTANTDTVLIGACARGDPQRPVKLTRANMLACRVSIAMNIVTH